MSFARRQLFKHKHLPGGAGGGPYVSPFLFEAFSTRSGAPAWDCATGAYTTNTGNVLTCVRASSGYCLGRDGLYHLLGSDTVRVEPAGLLVEGASTNIVGFSQAFGSWALQNVTVTDNTTDVLDPTGAHGASKVVSVDTTGATANSLISLGTNGRSATAYTMTCYALGSVGGEVIYLQDYDGATLHSRAITLTTSWQRFTFTYTSAATGSATTAIGVQRGFGTPDLEVGQPAATYYLWGCQIEALPFATSYIPTSGAAATRDADSLEIAAASNPLVPSTPGDWSMGCTVAPLGAWYDVTVNGHILSMGDYASADSTTISQSQFNLPPHIAYYNWAPLNSNGTGGTLQQQSPYTDGVANPGPTVTYLMRNNRGFCSTSPNGVAPVNVGQVGSFQGKIYLGGYTAFPGNKLNGGHMRDIFFDNIP